MNNTITVDQRVEVISVFKNTRNWSSICLPVKMKYKNQYIIFSEIGMKHPTLKGKRMVHVFDMSDGVNDYRLEFDAESLTWTLIAITES
ncbi:MAG TPA: hypothetical protein VMR76_00265 [Candidatus Saccharimonadia bacterium]|nr:hypothetical protein [Candidatus Saccharimonadia bacterium]